MIQSEVEYLFNNFTVIENEPSTVEELVELIGADALVSEAVSNLRYRSKYPRVYKAVAAALAESTGFEREVKETKTNKDGTVTNVYENETSYLKRFLAVDPENNRAILQGLFDTHAQAEPLYVKSERSSFGGKVSAAAQEAANNAFLAGETKVEQLVTAIESRVPGYTVARDPNGNVTTDSLARGIQAFTKHIEREAKKAAEGELGL